MNTPAPPPSPWQRWRLFIIGGVILLLVGGWISFKRVQFQRAEDEISKIELLDVQVGLGEGRDGITTGIFGTLLHNGEYAVRVAKLEVSFLGDNGEVLGVKDFYPVNRYSLESKQRLQPGDAREFGFNLDPFAPKGWNGQVEVKLTALELE